jgi:hypothetical protein
MGINVQRREKYDKEFKGIKKTKDSKDESHEMHSRIQSVLGHRRNEDILKLKVDSVKRKLAQYKQKWGY